MIWTETQVKVIVSDEMIDYIQKVLEGLGYLEDILYENSLYFHAPSTDDYSPEDVHNVKEFLETLADPRCEFE